MGAPDPREVARQQARLRVGDPERERAASALGDHYASGRLDHAEYSERLDAVWSSRTRADLDVLFTDLPATTAPVAPPVRGAGPRVPSGVLVALLVAAAFMLVVSKPALTLVLVVVAFILLKRNRARARQDAGPPVWR